MADGSTQRCPNSGTDRGTGTSDPRRGCGAVAAARGAVGLLSCCKGCQFWETPENLSSERPASCAARASENRGGFFWGVLKEVEAG